MVHIARTRLRKKIEEIQSFADSKDMKKFHDALETTYGPKSSGATTLLSVDGSTLLTDKELKVKLSSFKSRDNINEKGDGSYRAFGSRLISESINLAT